jgi:CubicO group peptidase (beta-lactamase class C family)
MPRRRSFARRARARVAFGFALVLAVAWSGSPVASAPDPGAAAVFPPELDAYMKGALDTLKLPGAAIAVVKDGKVVVARGYGVRELGRSGAVDANTVFDVASLTKAFTGAVVASLVDEKKMGWDEPVRRYLPGLEFPDPYLTANVTVRDLLCHRVGIRPTNRAWYFTAVTRPQLLGLVRKMEPSAPFRTRLSYWNIGYAIVGEASAAAAGRPWEELVTTRFLEPLGMTRSTVDFDAVPGMGNVASGHEWIAGRQIVIPRETNRRSTAPAGVLHSSARDLARWMLFQLGDTTVAGGRRLLSAEALYETQIAQFVQPAPARFRAARQMRFFPAYGLGWQVFDYKGHRMAWHSGNGDGHLAYLAMLPDEKLGVVVLVNTATLGSRLPGALAGRILDHYLGEPGRDDRAELRVAWVEQEKAVADAEEERRRVRPAGTVPSRPLADYAGAYEDKLGLAFDIGLEADTLRLRYGGGEPATLEHWHHDVFRVRWSNPFHDKILPTFLAFELDPAGAVTRLHSTFWGDEVDARRR